MDYKKTDEYEWESNQKKYKKDLFKSHEEEYQDLTVNDFKLNSVYQYENEEKAGEINYYFSSKKELRSYEKYYYDVKAFSENKIQRMWKAGNQDHPDMLDMAAKYENYQGSKKDKKKKRNEVLKKKQNVAKGLIADYEQYNEKIKDFEKRQQEHYDDPKNQKSFFRGYDTSKYPEALTNEKILLLDMRKDILLKECEVKATSANDLIKRKYDTELSVISAKITTYEAHRYLHKGFFGGLPSTYSEDIKKLQDEYKAKLKEYQELLPGLRQSEKERVTELAKSAREEKYGKNSDAKKSIEELRDEAYDTLQILLQSNPDDCVEEINQKIIPLLENYMQKKQSGKKTDPETDRQFQEKFSHQMIKLICHLDGEALSDIASKLVTVTNGEIQVGNGIATLLKDEDYKDGKIAVQKKADIIIDQKKKAENANFGSIVKDRASVILNCYDKNEAEREYTAFQEELALVKNAEEAQLASKGVQSVWKELSKNKEENADKIEKMLTTINQMPEEVRKEIYKGFDIKDLTAGIKMDCMAREEDSPEVKLKKEKALKLNNHYLTAYFLACRDNFDFENETTDTIESLRRQYVDGVKYIGFVEENTRAKEEFIKLGETIDVEKRSQKTKDNDAAEKKKKDKEAADKKKFNSYKSKKRKKILKEREEKEEEQKEKEEIEAKRRAFGDRKAYALKEKEKLQEEYRANKLSGFVKTGHGFIDWVIKKFAVGDLAKKKMRKIVEKIDYDQQGFTSDVTRIFAGNAAGDALDTAMNVVNSAQSITGYTVADNLLDAMKRDLDRKGNIYISQKDDELKKIDDTTYKPVEYLKEFNDAVQEERAEQNEERAEQQHEKTDAELVKEISDYKVKDKDDAMFSLISKDLAYVPSAVVTRYKKVGMEHPDIKSYAQKYKYKSASKRAKEAKKATQKFLDYNQKIENIFEIERGKHKYTPTQRTVLQAEALKIREEGMIFAAKSKAISKGDEAKRICDIKLSIIEAKKELYQKSSNEADFKKEIKALEEERKKVLDDYRKNESSYNADIKKAKKNAAKENAPDENQKKEWELEYRKNQVRQLARFMPSLGDGFLGKFLIDTLILHSEMGRRALENAYILDQDNLYEVNHEEPETTDTTLSSYGHIKLRFLLKMMGFDSMAKELDNYWNEYPEGCAKLGRAGFEKIYDAFVEGNMYKADEEASQINKEDEKMLKDVNQRVDEKKNADVTDVNSRAFYVHNIKMEEYLLADLAQKMSKDKKRDEYKHLFEMSLSLHLKTNEEKVKFDNNEGEFDNKKMPYKQISLDKELSKLEKQATVLMKTLWEGEFDKSQYGSFEAIPQESKTKYINARNEYDTISEELQARYLANFMGNVLANNQQKERGDRLNEVYMNLLTLVEEKKYSEATSLAVATMTQMKLTLKDITGRDFRKR